MSRDEFLARGETDGKWELDDGILHITEASAPGYWFIILPFCRHLGDCLDSFETPSAQFYHEMNTVLSRELQRAPEPDIVIICNENRNIVERSHVAGVPDSEVARLESRISDSRVGSARWSIATIATIALGFAGIIVALALVG